LLFQLIEARENLIEEKNKMRKDAINKEKQGKNK
jgi:hypothetical protein